MDPYTWTCQCWPTKKLNQLCADTRSSLKDLPGEMDDRKGWRDRERDKQTDRFREICVVSAIWWWWLWWWLYTHTYTHIYIYIHLTYAHSQRQSPPPYIYIYIYTTLILIRTHTDIVQSAGAVEYTDCISAGGTPTPNECPAFDTKQSDGKVSVRLDLWWI